MRTWENVLEGLQKFFTEFGNNFVEYILQFIFLTVILYFVFKILKVNKGGKFIAVVVLFLILTGVTFALSTNFSADMLLLVIVMVALLVFTMFNTEIKRSLLDLNMRKNKNKMDNLTVSGIDLIIEETVRAVQNMSKKGYRRAYSAFQRKFAGRYHRERYGRKRGDYFAND